MVQPSRNAPRSSSPLIGIFGSIAVIGLLLILAYEFQTPDSDTPAAAGPTEVQPAPK
jgi:hypothetical protein